MSKWEYTEIIFEYIGSPLCAVVRDGRDLGVSSGVKKKKIYPKFRNYINQLGKEGWELVTVIHNRAYLKRETTEET